MIFSITQHIHETQNKYESCSNNKILTGRLCACSACCSIIIAYVSLAYKY